MSQDVPGTIHLLRGTDAEHATSSSAIILQPRPSADPEDPLNWERFRKQLAIWQVFLYVFAIGIATAVQYSVLTQISDDTGITIGQLNLGTGLMFLFLGWGCLLWQPVAMIYGRRGVYIASCILSIIPMVWAPYSKSAGEWYAHRSLLGLFAAPVESLPEVSVPDLFFAHERGTFMAIYAFVLFGSNFLAPFFAGFINDRVGWHPVMYFGAAVLAACVVINFFLMEETLYFRANAEGDKQLTSLQEIPAKVAPVLDDSKEEVPTISDTRSIHQGQIHQPPPSYLSKLRIFKRVNGSGSPTQIWQHSWRALTNLIFYPNIVWAGLLYGTNLAWYNVLNGTTSSILGSPPYDFKPTMVGVAYLSPFLSASIACFWSGKFADWLMLRLAHRNDGVREPEQRLWGLLVSGVLSSSGLILWGIGASKGIHFMGLIFGLAFVSFGVVVGGGISLSYAVDCFKEIADESMVTVIIIRNTLGFAFSYAITPWIEGEGLQNCFIEASMISLACTLSFLVMVFFGKRLRKMSADRYWKVVAEKGTTNT